MKRFAIVLAAVAMLTFGMSALIESTIDAQRGGRGGRGGNWNKYKNKNKSKGPSEEEIKKLKEKYPDTWEEELEKLKEKYKKGGKGWKGRNDVNSELIPLWNQQTSATWMAACDGNQPIVLAFVAKKDQLNTKYFVHKKAAEASRESVTFVWVLEGTKQIVRKSNEEAERIKGFGEKKEEEASEETKKRREADAKILERSRLSQADLWKAYAVDKADTFIVCDKYGNEFKRFTRKPSGTSVLSATKKIEKEVKKADEEAEKALAKFNESEKASLPERLKITVEGIQGYIGIPNVEKLRAALEELLEPFDEPLETAIENKNEKALKDFAKKFEGTRIATSAQKALDEIASAKAAKDPKASAKK